MSHSPNLNQLKAFSVGGFRCIASDNPVTIPLDGVTALCGLNSAGKSSALYALRLLAQSLDREPYAAHLHLVGSLASRSEFRTPESIFHQGKEASNLAFRVVTHTANGWENHEFIYSAPSGESLGDCLLPLASFRHFRLETEAAETPNPWCEEWEEVCSREIRRMDPKDFYSRIIEETANGRSEAGITSVEGALEIWNSSLAAPEKRHWLSLPTPGELSQREFAELYESIDLKADSEWDDYSPPSLLGLDSGGSREVIEYPWLECLSGWSDVDEKDEHGQFGPPFIFNVDSEELCWDYYLQQRLAGSWDAISWNAPPEECRVSLKELVVEFRRLQGDRSEVRGMFEKTLEEDGYGQIHEKALFALYYVKLQERYFDWCGRSLTHDCQELLSLSECHVPDHLGNLQELAPVLWLSYLNSGTPKYLDGSKPATGQLSLFSSQDGAPHALPFEESTLFEVDVEHESKKIRSVLHGQQPGVPPLGLLFPVREAPFRRGLGISKAVARQDRGSEESAVALAMGRLIRTLNHSFSLLAAPGIRNPLEGERGQDASLIAQLAFVEKNSCNLPLPDGATQGLPTAKEALNAWLTHLGLAEVHHFETDQRGGTFAVMKKSHSEKPGMLLDDQGEGARQVIYILIQAILARPGDILVWQQPEVHLHPAAEARMAEFALALEAVGMSVLVETHSTHLLEGLRLGVLERRNQIQRRKAETNALDYPVLNILFFSIEDGCSRVEQVELDKYGQIVNWPVGFLDERQDLDRRLLESYILSQRLENNPEKEQG